MSVSTVDTFPDQEVDIKKASSDISKDNLNPDSSKNVQSYCQLCHKQFSTKFNLNKHIRKLHSSALKRSEKTAQTSKRKLHSSALKRSEKTAQKSKRKLHSSALKRNENTAQTSNRKLHSSALKRSENTAQTSNCRFICDICHEMFLDKLSFSNHYLLHKIMQQNEGNNKASISNQYIIVYVDETKNPDPANTTYQNPITVELSAHNEHPVGTVLPVNNEHLFGTVLPVNNEHPFGTVLPVNNEQSVPTIIYTSSEPSVNSENPIYNIKLDSSTIGNNCGSTNTKTRYRCQFCAKNYYSKYTLKRHQEKAHKLSNDIPFQYSSLNFACYICDQIFLDEDSVRDHYSEHRKQPHHTKNNKNIDNEVIIENEVSAIDEVVIYSEEISNDNESTLVNDSCSAESTHFDQSILSKNSLIDKHNLKETKTDDKKNVSSMDCIPLHRSTDPENRLFERNTSKNNVNIKNRRFRCKKCQKKFTKKYNLYRHIRKKHLILQRTKPIPAKKTKKTQTHSAFPPEESNRKFVCDICDEMFLDKASLQDHYLVHRNNMQINAACNDTINIQGQSIIVCANESSLDEQSSPQQFLLTRYCMPTKLKPFLCHICKESFKEKSHLKSHLASHKAEIIEMSREKFICDSCKEELKDRESLELHLLKHEIQKSFICYLCKETFETENYLKKHQSLHTDAENKVQFLCRVCNKIFDQNHDLNQHLLTHSNANTTTQVQDESSVCRICNKSFEDRGSLICHLAVHDVGKGDDLNTKIICILCNKRFTNQQSFQAHLSEHTNQTKILCNICDEVFSSKKSLEKHMDSHKERDIKSKLLCEICDKSFGKSHQLSQHLLTHSVTNFSSKTEKEHLCHICNDSFDEEIDLTIHLELHEIKGTNTNLENEIFTCKTCNKKIKGIGDFRLHLLQHTNQKIFICEVCHTSFGSQIAIQKHMKVHKNQQLYFCDICKKSFNQKHDLNQHELVHKDGNKFFCGLCSQIFKIKSQLKKHMQKCQAKKQVDLKKNINPLGLSGKAKKIFVTIPVRNSSSYSIHSQLHSFPSSLKY